MIIIPCIEGIDYMNFKRRCEFTRSLKTIKLDDLKFLRDWLKSKESEADREDKMELLDIEIQGRESLLRRAESL